MSFEAPFREALSPSQHLVVSKSNVHTLTPASSCVHSVRDPEKSAKQRSTASDAGRPLGGGPTHKLTARDPE